MKPIVFEPWNPIKKLTVTPKEYEELKKKYKQQYPELGELLWPNEKT